MGEGEGMTGVLWISTVTMGLICGRLKMPAGRPVSITNLGGFQMHKGHLDVLFSFNLDPRKMRRGLIALLAAMVLLFAIVGIALAWDPTFSSSPYTGNFWLHTTSDNQAGVADWIKWSSAGLAAMRSDADPRLDMTADCTPDNPGDDQLDYIVVYTNIPNNGVDVWSDCGWPWIREEVELKINTGSVAAETAYYYQVHYRKNERNVSGAINLSYQRDNSPTHDWLDKVLYDN